MSEVSNIKKEEGNKKKGRRKKSERVAYELNKEQSKFFVDLSGDPIYLDKVQNMLVRANTKEYGRDILFKDLALFGILKLTEKDLERVQENSLSDMEKIECSLLVYNKKNQTNLSLGQYLIKRLNIQ